MLRNQLLLTTIALVSTGIVTYLGATSTPLFFIGSALLGISTFDNLKKLNTLIEIQNEQREALRNAAQEQAQGIAIPPREGRREAWVEQQQEWSDEMLPPAPEEPREQTPSPISLNTEEDTSPTILPGQATASSPKEEARDHSQV